MNVQDQHKPIFSPQQAPETFGGRAPPGPAGGAHSAPPDPLTDSRGAASRQGRGKKGKEGGRKRGEGIRGRKRRKGREGKGRGGRERIDTDPPPPAEQKNHWNIK
jgi:hypothetical protein